MRRSGRSSVKHGAKCARLLEGSLDRAAHVPVSDMRVVPERRLALRMPGEHLHHAGVDTSARQHRHERHPQCVEVNNAPLVILRTDDGHGLLNTVPVHALLGLEPCQACMHEVTLEGPQGREAASRKDGIASGHGGRPMRSQEISQSPRNRDRLLLSGLRGVRADPNAARVKIHIAPAKPHKLTTAQARPSSHCVYELADLALEAQLPTLLRRHAPAYALLLGLRKRARRCRPQ